MNSAALYGTGVLHSDDVEVILNLFDPESSSKESVSNKYLRLSRALKSTLLAKDNNIRNSHSSTGHEIYSSIPTYQKALSTGDPIYLGISFASIGIAQLINYQGSSEENEFNIALSVWAEFRQAREASRKEETEDKQNERLHAAFKTLEKRVRQFDYIFSKNRDYDPKKFDSHKYDVVAKEKGIWQDPEKYRATTLSYLQKTKQRIAHTSRGLSLKTAWESAVKFSAHMAVDALTKWTDRKTYSDIKNGFRSAPSYLTDFKFFSSGLRESKHPKTTLEELSAVRRLEDHEIIPELIESGKIERSKVEETVRKRRAIREDIFNGKIMNGGFMLESVFVLGHFGEGVLHGYEVAMQKISASLLDADGHIQLPAQLLNPEINKTITELLEHHAHSENASLAFGLNVYSIAMVMGAYAFLGGSAYKIRERIRNNEKFLAETYAEIDAAYTEKFGDPEPTGDHDEHPAP